MRRSSPKLISRLRPALADAAAQAPHGRLILVRLESIAELYAWETVSQSVAKAILA
jgi:hypothetical protein